MQISNNLKKICNCLQNMKKFMKKSVSIACNSFSGSEWEGESEEKGKGEAIFNKTCKLCNFYFG